MGRLSCKTDVNRWERNRGAVLVISLALFLLIGCDNRSRDIRDLNQPPVVRVDNVFETVQKSRDDIDGYVPTDITLITLEVKPASSGTGYVTRFDWRYTKPPLARAGAWRIDWEIETFDSVNMSAVLWSESFFDDEEKHFVSQKLEETKEYTILLKGNIWATDENDQLFFAQIIYKRIKVDLRSF